ncbi:MULTISPECIES: hypothetical protein [Mycobacteriaceae]|uniref:Secreted protein n=1 Tax=Mycolicibacterium mucogenicum DSM 44124 TaxID=1226753 RepID=A0A8H2JBJ4_MYCMU|nr:MULTISPECIES: hypothetical protein [Mycobacteriaceae]KAB7754022.1 hypothetical protein MMUC44124_22640 [Mycolicibacterium mucogenicum DSM 44124]QPG70800.1 hypothetical protein C1S78_007545 [Mycolicibacterium mucogenicum DSM 44124]SEB03338.1 hypothetical protein SAMN04488580_106153 [Mycobacterium sp. 283mftsu]
MRTSVILAAAVLISSSAAPAPAFADDEAAPAPPPAAHHVRYVVSADAPIFSYIYYREVDPPTWSDYSHNPYEFSPRADVTVGPNQPWVFDTTLNDPNLWATVMVQSGEAPNFKTPAFKCRLEVDGAVVKEGSGPRGALCSIRNW